MSDVTSGGRDGLRFDADVSITMDGGLVLRADVYRPVRVGKYPVILSRVRYGKGLRFEDLYHLNSAEQNLVRAPLGRSGSVRYGALGDGVTFLTPPLPKETEITGPLAALRQPGAPQ